MAQKTTETPESLASVVVGRGSLEAPLAPVTDERVIEFVTLFTRQEALQLYNAYRTAKTMEDLWNGGISAAVPNDSSPIQDGNTLYPATGADVWNVRFRATEFITSMEENGNARLNTILAIVQFGR